jgi:hypothetical protein
MKTHPPMEKNNEVLDHKITYQGKEYLMLPDAETYTGMGKTAIHQIIVRQKKKWEDVKKSKDFKKIEDFKKTEDYKMMEDFVQRQRYVYVSLDRCEKLKMEWAQKMKSKKVNEILTLNIPEEEINKFLLKMKQRDNKK